MKLIDTTVAVDHLRGHQPAVDLLKRLVTEEGGPVASEVVRFELLAGVRDGEMAELERFFAAVTWVPVDEAVARAAGALTRRYHKAYIGIDDADYMIAATALFLDVELLTTNVHHFPMIDALTPAY